MIFIVIVTAIVIIIAINASWTINILYSSNKALHQIL